MIILSFISMIFSDLMTCSMESVIFETSSIFQFFTLIITFILSRSHCCVIIEFSRVERPIFKDIDSISIGFTM